MTDDRTNDQTRDTELEPQPGNEGGNQFDDPNRQAVGLDPAWVEGTGGSGSEPKDGGGDESGDGDPDNAAAEPVTQPDNPAAAAASPGGGGGEDLDAMTKLDLLALAKERGVTPANNDMTKQELIDGIRATGRT